MDSGADFDCSGENQSERKSRAMDSSLSKVWSIFNQLIDENTIKFIKDDDEYFECLNNDRKIIRENISLFTRDVVEGFILGSKDLKSDIPNVKDMLLYQERVHEVISRICEEKEFFDLMGMAAFKQGTICEEINKQITALECYEAAQEAAMKCNDRKNYLRATVNMARMSVASHLYYKAKPLLEEAIDLAEEFDEEDILMLVCNLLMHIYQKEQNTDGIQMIQSRLSNYI